MNVLIVYATTEGQTRKLVHSIMRTLADDGHSVVAEEAPSDAPYPDPAAYDAALVAGSLHIGRYQSNLVRFARARQRELGAMPNAFISVSLAAAGHNPDDWAGLDKCLAAFEHETGWTPGAVHQAAGAIRYSQYDFFKRLMMKHIAAQRGEKTVTSRDYDMTDYEALNRFCRGFVAKAAQARAGSAAAAALAGEA